MSSIDPSQTLYITNIKGRANVEGNKKIDERAMFGVLRNNRD